MVHHVKDLSAGQRLAIESLLGRALSEEESITIAPARLVKDAPAGEERVRAFGQYQEHLDRLARRVESVPEGEIDSTIEDAIRHARLKTK